MKLISCIILIFCLSALSAQTLIKHPLYKQAFQISYEIDFDKNINELIYFSYKRHISNNAHKIGLNIFYDLTKDEDKYEYGKLDKLRIGFSLNYLFLHYPRLENDLSFYYGIGLKNKYYYQEIKEVKNYTFGDIKSTNIHKKWNPIFSPCFGYEYKFSSNLSFNFEYSIAMGYSNEELKIKGRQDDDYYIIRNIEKEEFFLNPVNFEIGSYYYF